MAISETLQKTLVRLPDGARVPAAQALRRPEITLESARSNGELISRRRSRTVSSTLPRSRPRSNTKATCFGSSRRSTGLSTPNGAESLRHFLSIRFPDSPAKWFRGSPKRGQKRLARRSEFPASPLRPSPSLAPTSTASSVGAEKLAPCHRLFRGKVTGRWRIESFVIG